MTVSICIYKTQLSVCVLCIANVLSDRSSVRPSVVSPYQTLTGADTRSSHTTHGQSRKTFTAQSKHKASSAINDARKIPRQKIEVALARQTSLGSQRSARVVSISEKLQSSLKK